MALIALTYAAWAVLTIFSAQIGLWLAIPALALTLTMHSSLQHETVHGHPFASRRLSEAVMSPGLGLFIPYQRFRDLHLAHHRDANLTDPYDDPESAYFDPQDFYSLPLVVRLILVANNTFIGRFILGPAVGLEAFFRTERRALMRGNPAVVRAWAIHMATLVPVLLWLTQVATMPVWAYGIAAYLGLSILKIRTFVEHQAHELSSGRSVIIEDRGLLALLFLNNNLHSVHHAHPQVPWYDLPALFNRRRMQYLLRNRGYYFASYGEVIRRYFLRPKEPVPHPFYRQDG